MARHDGRSRSTRTVAIGDIDREPIPVGRANATDHVLPSPTWYSPHQYGSELAASHSTHIATPGPLGNDASAADFAASNSSRSAAMINTSTGPPIPTPPPAMHPVDPTRPRQTVSIYVDKDQMNT